MYSVLLGRDTIFQTESLDEAYLFYLHSLQENTPALNIVDDDNIAFTDEQCAALNTEWASLSPEEREERINKVKKIRELRNK